MFRARRNRLKHILCVRLTKAHIYLPTHFRQQAPRLRNKLLNPFESTGATR